MRHGPELGNIPVAHIVGIDLVHVHMSNILNHYKLPLSTNINSSLQHKLLHFTTISYQSYKTNTMPTSLSTIIPCDHPCAQRSHRSERSVLRLFHENAPVAREETAAIHPQLYGGCHNQKHLAARREHHCPAQARGPPP